MGLLDNGGYWQGGQKVGGRDVLAGLLAVVGDALAQQNGGEAIGMKGLLESRLGAREEAMKAQAAQAKRGQEWEDWLRRKKWEQANAQPDIPPMVRDVEAWRAMTPEQKAAAAEMYSTRSPWRITGEDGVPRQMPSQSAPDFIPDEEWGGGTGNGAVRFP